MKLYTYNQKLAESVWWNLLWMTLGSLLMTICIQSVAAPHDFLAGGVMGVALLVAYWTGTLTPLLWYMLICLPIYIGGWFFVGRRFLLYTAYGTLCTTVFGMFITFQISLSTEIYAGPWWAACCTERPGASCCALWAAAAARTSSPCCSRSAGTYPSASSTSSSTSCCS